MDDRNLVRVYTLSDPVRAEMIKNLLQDEGIRCALDGLNAATQMPLSPFEIRVLVATEQAERARELIAEHEAHAASGHQEAE